MPELRWLGDHDAKRAARRVPYRLLEHVETVGDATTGNCLIQGDNLEALKALIPNFAGRVNCIYSDPPFNTQQALPDYDDNLEHSIWLSLIYPALELQRDLLAESGTIFIHIDDNELGYLMAIADEVMGRKNRVGVITFKQGAATGHKAINPGLVNVTNFLLVYAKNKGAWKPHRLFTGRERDKRYNQFLVNPDDPYVNWRVQTLTSAFARSKNSPIQEIKKTLGSSFEEKLNEFVIENASRVIQSVRPDYDAISEDARQLIDRSRSNPSAIFLLKRDGYSDMYFKSGQRWIFYRDKLKEIDGELIAGEPLTNLWNDLLSNNLHKEGGVEFPKGKKPEALLKRIFELVTKPGDLVLDAYLGSGTTAAVAHKMNLRYLGIERGVHATEKCLPRLKSVVEGEQGGVSRSLSWTGGGGFQFYKLGESAFDPSGRINPAIRFGALAAYLWFLETGKPHATGRFDSPLLGVHEGTGIVLLYNGILGDRRPESGNVLTQAVWKAIVETLPKHSGPRVIYGEACRLSAGRLKSLNAVFRQIPYDIRMR